MEGREAGGPEAVAEEGVVGEREGSGGEASEHAGAGREEERDRNRDCGIADGSRAPRSGARERPIVERDDRDGDDGALFRTDSDAGGESDPDNTDGAESAGAAHETVIREQGGEHSEGGQHVGAADDVGHGFGEHGMERPERAQCQRGGNLFEENEPERVHERDVDGMQPEIEPVIAVRLGPAAQNGIVIEIGERGERPVEAGEDGLIVGAAEDAVEILAGGRVNARVLEDCLVVVEQKRRVERIRVREQREEDDGAGERVRDSTRRSRAGGFGGASCRLFVERASPYLYSIGRKIGRFELDVRNGRRGRGVHHDGGIL